MSVQDLTIEILREIRDEIRATRTDLGERIDQTNSRLDQTNSRLDSVEHALLDLAEQQRFLVRNAKRNSVREKQYGGEIADLRHRVEALESRTPDK